MLAGFLGLPNMAVDGRRTWLNEVMEWSRVRPQAMGGSNLDIFSWVEIFSLWFSLSRTLMLPHYTSFSHRQVQL